VRRILNAGLALVVAALVAAMPVSASAASGGDGGGNGGRVRVPQAAFDLPAGSRCDFAIHSEPVVDEVRKLVLATYPDGSPERELYMGDLILKVTNTETGAVTHADAGGTAMIEYGEDRSMTWYVTGPVLLGFAENAGTLPRGLWIVDGQFVVEFSPTFYKTITMVHGTTHNVCTDLD
jgi:hypothetical protein